MGTGNLTGEYVYNNNSRTWWFDLDTVKPGCSPACVVYEDNSTADVNWRCTGVILPQALVSTSQQAELGQILVDANGMTLYIFTKDSINTSTCNAACAANWPPLRPTGNEASAGLPGALGVITRNDSTQQVAYNGMPLYYYAGDSNPGDITGKGIGGVWFVAQPNMTGFPAASSAPSTMTLAEATAMAENSSCMSAGNLTSSSSYNNNSKTWWIGLDTVKPGCSPACVVYENRSAEANWMCTGLVPPAAKPIVGTYQSPSLGEILTDNRGMTLYVYLMDSTNSATCYGSCSSNWPPLALTSVYTLNVTGLPGTLGNITRIDGLVQVTYNGMPLYTYNYDNKQGDIRGNGINKLWYAVTTNMTTFPGSPPPASGGSYY